MSSRVEPAEFTIDESFARAQDEADPLQECRQRFEIPRDEQGEFNIYFCGNSLGLMPRDARELVAEELDDWSTLAVDAHFRGRRPWFAYHEQLREMGARMVGGRPDEVVFMNSLTVNLHLMMVSFFQPSGPRTRILIDGPTFPSDLYAVQSHLRTRGLDPAEHLLTISPRAGEHTIRTDDIEALLEEQGDTIALILLAGVNFFTGQAYDIPRVTRAAQARGCTIGLDLAHAAGNIELALHDWNVDFACWCSYKYLNGGPGAIAGCFVHERHARDIDLPRYAGWWGNDPETRFDMLKQDRFVARPDADGWQLSNPPILAMTPLLASLRIFDEVGMLALRDKSRRLTGYLRFLIEQQPHDWFEIITPPDDDARGCQVSLLVHDRVRERFGALERAGVVCDLRRPNVIRAAPVPLYNTFHDVWRFARLLAHLD